MPWPDVDNDPVGSDVSGVLGFREAFRKVPAEYLALASHVINAIGHWYPGQSANGFMVPGRESGATWKFAHYADQELRERLGLPARGTNGHDRGFGYAVHEGAIRVTYADPDTWQWIEVAPATETGFTAAKRIAGLIRGMAEGKTKRTDIANAYYAGFEQFKASKAWPAEWLPFMDHRFMVEEQEMKNREAAKAPNLEKTRAELLQRFERDTWQAKRELDGKLWFLDRGIPIENLIYYDHTKVFTFGWRDLMPATAVSAILDVVSEFPYAYCIKCADGRVLENVGDRA